MRKLYGNVNRQLFDSIASQAVAEQHLLDVPAEPVGIAAGEIERALAALETDGFAVLGNKLLPEACDELEATARGAMCHVIGGDASQPSRARWNDDAPPTVRLDVDENDLVQPATAQRLIADESLMVLAQRYLGSAPVQDLAAMWWSAAAGPLTTSNTDAAAQEFHFDLDRLRFLKVFVLLTDVDDSTGPHVYVRGSHRRKPGHLRQDGRNASAAVEAAYPGEVRRIGGPRGTVFLADTIGLHKGQPLERGHRLIFQLEFATSLFGAPYSRPVIFEPIPELTRLAAMYPRTFQRFQLGRAA